MTGDAGTGVLAFIEFENMPVQWPSAVPVGELPEVADLDSFEQWEAEHEVHEERGEPGLTGLLLALAPYLNSALVIRAAIWHFDGTYFTAKEWTVRPGATEVEVKDIEAMEDEHSLVSCD